MPWAWARGSTICARSKPTPLREHSSASRRASDLPAAFWVGPMSRNVIETILGAVVLIVAIGFGAWAYGRSNLGDTSGYELRAQFDRADGLDVGADVRISGIKVGRVLAQSLDQETYRAEVTFSVRNGIELPADSSAAIMS